MEFARLAHREIWHRVALTVTGYGETHERMRCGLVVYPQREHVEVRSAEDPTDIEGRLCELCEGVTHA